MGFTKVSVKQCQDKPLYLNSLSFYLVGNLSISVGTAACSDIQYHSLLLKDKLNFLQMQYKNLLPLQNNVWAEISAPVLVVWLTSAKRCEKNG